MTKVFVSYSREDREIVDRLARDLELRQAEVWIDRKLKPGEKYVDKILEQIAEADHLIIVLSESSRKSRWVAFEAGAILARASQDSDNVHLLQVGNTDAPDYLGARHAPRIDSGNYEASLVELCNALDIPVRVDMKSSHGGRSERHLKVFQAGDQWMELLAGAHGLECVLVDAAEKRARVQWTIPKSRLTGILNQPAKIKVRRPTQSERPWGTFDIGPKRGWRWSPFLFGPGSAVQRRKRFDAKLRVFLKGT